MAGPSAIFTDDFSSGTLANWTSVTRFSIDTTTGSLAAPSARAAVSNQTAFLVKTFGSSYSNLCLSWRVNVSARTGSIMLLRLRSTSSGPVARVLVNTSGVLALRSDVSGVTRTSTTALGSGWHALEVCGTVGAAGTWDLYRDGLRIVADGSRTPGLLRSGASSWGPNAAIVDRELRRHPRRQAPRVGSGTAPLPSLGVGDQGVAGPELQPTQRPGLVLHRGPFHVAEPLDPNRVPTRLVHHVDQRGG